MNKRPPIGIPPRFIVNEFRKGLNNPFEIMTFDLRRFIDIKNALYRYRNESYIPHEWFSEYHLLSNYFLYHSQFNN